MLWNIYCLELFKRLKSLQLNDRKSLSIGFWITPLLNYLLYLAKYQLQGTLWKHLGALGKPVKRAVVSEESLKLIFTDVLERWVLSP